MSSLRNSENAMRPIPEYFKSKSPVMVKIYVGKDEDPWTLPEDLLCDRVQYFRAAFKNDFKEGVEKVICLEDDDPATFGKIVAWLFGAPVDGYSKEWKDASYLDCCNLFILADKLGLLNLCNDVIKAFETKCAAKDRKNIPTAEIVHLVYNKTPNSSICGKC